MKHIFWMAYNSADIYSAREEWQYNIHINDVGVRRTFARDPTTPPRLLNYGGFISVPMQVERVS